MGDRVEPLLDERLAAIAGTQQVEAGVDVVVSLLLAARGPCFHRVVLHDEVEAVGVEIVDRVADEDDVSIREQHVEATEVADPRQQRLHLRDPPEAGGTVVVRHGEFGTVSRGTRLGVEPGAQLEFVPISALARFQPLVACFFREHDRVQLEALGTPLREQVIAGALLVRGDHHVAGEVEPLERAHHLVVEGCVVIREHGQYHHPVRLPMAPPFERGGLHAVAQRQRGVWLR